MRGLGLGILASSGAGGAQATRSLDCSTSTGLPPYFPGVLSLANATWGAYDRSTFAVALSFYGTGGSTALHYLANKDTEFSLFIDGTTGKLHFSTSSGGDFVTTMTFSASTWYHLKVWHDSTLGGDKIGVAVNGVDITAFDSFTNPSAPMNTTTTDMNLFTSSDTFHGTVGLLYMPGFFSGSIPSNAQLYGTRPKPVLTLPGIWSCINSQASDAIGYDVVKNTTWSTSSISAYSATIP